jgi:hypothetical protein
VARGTIELLSPPRETQIDQEAYQDRDLVDASTLTLLALIIGFSFSMAIERYDQRKN